MDLCGGTDSGKKFAVRQYGIGKERCKNAFYNMWIISSIETKLSSTSRHTHLARTCKLHHRTPELLTNTM